MEIFTEKTIKSRREKLQVKLEAILKSDDLILVFCGEPLQKPGGLDQTYSFLPHPDYYWLTGSRRDSGVVAYCKSDSWTDFSRHVTRDEKLWEGNAHEAGLNKGIDISAFEPWLAKRKFERILVLGQPSFGSRSLEKNSDSDFRFQVQESLNQIRRVKDSSEIELIGQIAKMANKGYLLLQEFIRPGVTERQIQIEYEAEVLRAGSEKFPYDSIVGSGTNAAVLHAIPTAKVVQKGELVLVDAGADLHDYCVDITRVFSVDASFDSRQKMIYDLVLSAQTQAIQKCRPGVLWPEVHRTAALVMAEGLKSLNILKGETDALLESGAIATFFPHGVGHMVGLKVRDVGGIFNATPQICCGVRLRVDLELHENFVMTVEPGLYFVPALLDDSEIRRKHRDQVNWGEVEKWRGFGGVRIEDDIQVSSKGPVNLTSLVPK